MSKKNKMKLILSILFICLAMIFSFISLEHFVAPFVWLGLGWLAVALYFLIISKRKVKLIFLNIIVLLFTLSGFEAFLWLRSLKFTSDFRHEGDLYKKDYYFRTHDFLGYAPNINTKANSKKYFGNQLLFDVDYTIDANGLRKSPPSNESDQHDCIVFFGCSMVFGEGLEDDETIPYQLGLASGGKYRIYNFGFHGYGPHQMLSAIEHGLVQEIVACDHGPKNVIYIGLVEHALRSAGKISWDQHAPRYVLNQGQVYHAGRFDDGIFYTRPFFVKLLEYLKKCYIYQRISDKRRVMTDKDVELFLAIIKQSQIELAKIYPNCKFNIIMWNNNKYQEYASAMKGFQERNLEVNWINQILPDYDVNPKQYRIHPVHEKHPNALANQIVARYILEKIIEPQTGSITK